MKTGETLEPILNSAEIGILKKGANYPDSLCAGKAEWHGSYKQNYMANYIYATRVALKYGNVSKAKKVRGQTDTAKKNMADEFEKLGTKKFEWNQLLGVTPNTSAQSKRFRRIFLYGMAMHIATDAYAHSVWVEDSKQPGKFIHLIHSNPNKKDTWYTVADNSTKYVNRYRCAEDVASCAYIHFLNEQEGNIEDFMPGTKYGKGFRLGNCTKYALEVGSDSYSTSEIRSAFQKINLDVN